MSQGKSQRFFCGCGDSCLRRRRPVLRGGGAIKLHIKAGADAVACQLVVKLYKTPKLTTEEAARLEREYDKEMQLIQDEMDEIYEKLTTDFEKAKANFFAVLEEPVLKEH